MHAIAVGRVIDAAEVDELLEAQVRMIPELERRAQVVGRLDLERGLVEPLYGLDPEDLLQRFKKLLNAGGHRPMVQ